MTTLTAVEREEAAALAVIYITSSYFLNLNDQKEAYAKLGLDVVKQAEDFLAAVKSKRVMLQGISPFTRHLLVEYDHYYDQIKEGLEGVDKDLRIEPAIELAKLYIGYVKVGDESDLLSQHLQGLSISTLYSSSALKPRRFFQV